MASIFRNPARLIRLIFPYVDLWPLERGPHLTNAHSTQLVTQFHSIIKVLSVYECTYESTCEAITRTIRIDDVFLIKHFHWVNSYDRPRCGRCDYGGFSARGNHNSTMARCVDLCKVSDRSGDLGQILSIAPASCSPGSCFTFVANYNVSIRKEFFNLNFEVLDEKRS